MTPQLIGTPNVQYADGGSGTLTSASLTVQDGDVVVAKTVSENEQGISTAASTVANSTVMAHPGTQRAGGWCADDIYTWVVTGSPGTVVVTMPFTGAACHLMVVEIWRGAQLAGTPAINATKTWVGSTTGFSGSVTTVANDSIVSWVAGDWSAAVPGTVAWRSSATSDGATSNRNVASFYTTYNAYQTAATAGGQTFGTTTPSTSAVFSALAIEIQATASAAAYPYEPLMPPMNRH